MGRISGPLLDRFDLRIEVPPVAFTDLDLPADGEKSEVIAARVSAARETQSQRFADTDGVRVNADAEGGLLEEIAKPEADAREMLLTAAERFSLSARGYHRVLKVARTIADLAAEPRVSEDHLGEALAFRQLQTIPGLA